MKTIKLLEVGTEIYNHGDMENPSHFGIIVEVDPGGQFSPQYKIRISDEDYEHMKDERKQEYWISAYCFSDEYKGNGFTRFVTKEAYMKWRQQQLEVLQKRLAKYA